MNRALSLSQICSFGIGNKEYNENIDTREKRKMFIIRQSSNTYSLLSSGSNSPDSKSMGQGSRVKRRTGEVGRLNPELYRRKSLSSSSTTSGSGFGDIRLSYTWIGQKYDQLKIRIIKIKNIPVQYYRAGLYMRYRFMKINQTYSTTNYSVKLRLVQRL